MSEKTANQNKVVAEGGMDFLFSVLGNEDSLQDATLLYEVIRALSVLAQQNPPHTKSIVSLYLYLYIINNKRSPFSCFSCILFYFDEIRQLAD
jgi:hypothetical protein